MTLKIGIIGCGRIGCSFDDNSVGGEIRTHAGSYASDHNTKIVALCDIDKNKLNRYGRKYKVTNLYTKSTELFRNENLDCISICTLVDSHLDLVKKAVNHGIKGIFLEKPISNNLKNSKKIIQLCAKHKTSLVIDHKRRFDPFFHSLQKFIQDGRLGDIQFVNVFYGSGITNTCSHIFDVLRMFFGEVKNVEGRFSRINSGNSNDPNIDVNLEFKNKIICNMHSLDVRNYGMLEMDIFGTKGRIRFDLESNKVEYFKISTKNFLVYKNMVKSKIKVNRSKYSAIQLGVKNLGESVQYKTKPLCTGNDGYKSLELIIASHLSSIKRKKITLPLKENNFRINSR